MSSRSCDDASARLGPPSSGPSLARTCSRLGRGHLCRNAVAAVALALIQFVALHPTAPQRGRGRLLQCRVNAIDQWGECFVGFECPQQTSNRLNPGRRTGPRGWLVIQTGTTAGRRRRLAIQTERRSATEWCSTIPTGPTPGILGRVAIPTGWLPKYPCPSPSAFGRHVLVTRSSSRSRSSARMVVGTTNRRRVPLSVSSTNRRPCVRTRTSAAVSRTSNGELNR